MIKFTCENCKKTLEIPNTLAGRDWACPYCEKPIKVPLRGQELLKPPSYIVLSFFAIVLLLVGGAGISVGITRWLMGDRGEYGPLYLVLGGFVGIVVGMGVFCFTDIARNTWQTQEYFRLLVDYLEQKESQETHKKKDSSQA